MKNHLIDQKNKYFLFEKYHINYLQYFIPDIKKYRYRNRYRSEILKDFPLFPINIKDQNLIEKIYKILEENNNFDYYDLPINFYDDEDKMEILKNDLENYYRNSEIRFLILHERKSINFNSNQRKLNYSLSMGSSYKERENLFNFILNYIYN